MEITWHGNTCFTLKDSERTIVINPDEQAGNLEGNIVFSNLKDKTEEVKNAEKVFDWPGEYEAKGVPIMAISVQDTTVFFFEMDKIKVCHLGDLKQALSKEAVTQIDDVDILMIDVSDDSDLTLKASMEIIEGIDPRVVIPMGSGTKTAALKELGAEAYSPEPKFTLKSASDLPEDSRKVVLLEKK